MSRLNLRQRRKLEQQIDRAQPTARQSARSGLLSGENPHGYQLNAAGEPICNACKHSTNAAYVRTPDLVCWNCGSPLTPNSGFSRWAVLGVVVLLIVVGGVAGALV